MPGATLPNISIILPTLGGDTGVWDDEINAALTLLDAHDHTSGKGLRIKSAAINIDANLSFGGFAITAAGQLAFTAVAALAAGSKVLFVNSSDNELYWRTNGGTNVKLTSGASINTSLVGGIVGDYASVGAEVAYDDANDKYTFKQQSTKPWARIHCGGLQLSEFSTTESLFTRIICDPALAGSYDIQLPLALPGSTVLMQMSAAGAITVTNTIDNAVTFSSTVSATDYKLTAEMVLQVPSMMAQEETAGTHTHNRNPDKWTLAASAVRIIFPISLKVGDRIKSWKFYVQKTTAAALTINATLKSVRGTSTELLTDHQTAGSNANSPGYVPIGNSGATITVTAGTYYYATIAGDAGGGLTGDIIYMLEVNYDRP